MKYVIVYWSRYGNGKLVVETLADKLKQKKAETHIMTTDEANPAALPDADIYIFSSPTEAFNLQRNMRSFMKPESVRNWRWSEDENPSCFYR